MALIRHRFKAFVGMTISALPMVGPTVVMSDATRDVWLEQFINTRTADDDRSDSNHTPASNRLIAIAASSSTAPVHFTSDYRLDLSGWPPAVRIAPSTSAF